MILEPRQRLLLQCLRRHGPLSRSALHERTGMRPNTVGSATAELLAARLVREGDGRVEGRGRPRVPVEIDPEARHVLGVAIEPGRAEVAPVSLHGELLDEPAVATGKISAAIIGTAARLLSQRINRDTLAIGLTTPGFIDPGAHRMLFSSAVPGGRSASLQPIYDAAGDLPIALANDAHALAGHWSLQHPEGEAGDLLLVFFDDGQLGASLLVDGRPNRGCVHGANELGHTRLPVTTPPCYCGHTGCLERICSSAFLRQADADLHADAGRRPRRNGRHRRNGRADAPSADLRRRVAAYTGAGDDPGLDTVIDLLGLGLANAVNFTRVRRLVLVSEMTRHRPFADALTHRIREHTLGQLARRISIDLWDRRDTPPAQTAGCLVLAHLYCEGWHSLLTVAGQVQPAA